MYKDLLSQKLIPQSKISSLVKRLKAQGKTIVTFNGSFDLLHAGHIKSLLAAKEEADILIIPLNSDQSIKSYKGPARPIIPQRERALQLAALECVDYIVLFNETNCIKILDKIKPDIHCNGRDWGKNCVEREIVEKNGGKILLLPWTKGFSTTQLIKKIVQLYKKPIPRAVFIDRDGTLNVNDPEYVHKIKNFKFTKGAIPALKKLSQKTNYKIIIITNQSGVARGYYTEQEVKKLHQWIKKYLKERGVRITDILYCPHHEEASVPRYKKKCPFRKPGVGMIEKARDKYRLSLNDSWMIGDSLKDILAGRKMNMKTIRVKTQGKKTEDIQSKVGPHYKVQDLREAIEFILKEEE